MKTLKRKIKCILDLIYWPLLIFKLTTILLIIMAIVKEYVILVNIGLLLLLIDFCSIVVTLKYNKKAFYYILNQFISICNISIALSSIVFLWSRNYFFLILLGIGSFIFLIIGYVKIKHKKDLFIEEAEDIGKINLKEKKLNVKVIQWPSLSNIKDEKEITKYILFVMVVFSFVIRGSSFIDNHFEWLALIGAYGFFWLAGRFLWITKWILDWGKECGCTITTEFAEVEE